MSELLPCPCGKTPTALNLYAGHVAGKYACASGNCCDEWFVEFRANYAQLAWDGALKDIATKAWNESPRAQPSAEAVRRDAERYRWLLQECYRWPSAGRVCGREDQAQPVAIWTTFEGDDVDAAIDAALATQRQEGSNGNA